MMPRCCMPISGEFTPSYASILVTPNLKDAVEEVEQGPLQSSITALCTTCKTPYLMTGALDLFPSPSAHHAHMIVLSRRMRSPVFPPSNGGIP